MLGAITGDVVGSAYEFHNTKNTGFKLFLGVSSFTDDSVMTAAITHNHPEGIARLTLSRLDDDILDTLALFFECCPDYSGRCSSAAGIRVPKKGNDD